MTKKNIQVILSIFALTLASLGGLYYFSKQSKNKSAEQPQPAIPKPVQTPDTISDISFTDEQGSKKITVMGLREKTYRVRLFDTGNGFSVLFPNTNSAIKPEYLTPLPWVHAVSFEQKQFRGQPSVEMTVSTEDGVAIFDQFKAGALVIGLQNTKALMPKVAEKPKTEPVQKQVTQSKPKPKKV
ncbi:MAG: hypothetical protein R3A45_13335, partial [Bdellovibrionota bacterium]